MIFKRCRDVFASIFVFMKKVFVGRYVKMFTSTAVNIVINFQRKSDGLGLSTDWAKQLLDNYKTLRLKA